MANASLEYYKSPTYISGGDGKWVPEVEGEYQTQRLGLWLNHAGFRQHTTNGTFITNNGTFIMWLNSYEDTNLKFEGSGIEIGRDKFNPVKVYITINGPTGGISIEILN